MSLCITGAEESVAVLAARLNERGGLHELRLDLLQPFDEAVYALCARPNVVVTCRPRREGGAFAGSESERERILERALACGPGFLDLELASRTAFRQKLWRERATTRLIVSAHRFRVDEPAPYGDLESCEADILKLAIALDDAAQLQPLLNWAPRRVALRIGMGAAGRLSRVLYRHFGSPWTYVAASTARATAPGQLNLASAKRLRVEESVETLALLGGAQIAHSPGERVYNRLFARHKRELRYVAVVSTRAAETAALLHRLGCRGLSVTMPAKGQLLHLVDEADEASRRLGALNTLRWHPDGRVQAWNTDANAVRQMIAGRAAGPALVLGAGGAAAAAALALMDGGHTPTIASRNEEKAVRLLLAIGSKASNWLPWDKRHGDSYPIVVNTTPVGTSPDQSPLDSSRLFRGQLVIDSVLAPGQTRLVTEARQQGTTAYDGLDWWVRQGAAQLHHLIDGSYAPQELRGIYRECEEEESG